LQLADDPNRELKGVITELGNSADAVSTFPVVVGIDKSATGIKSGMAVEAQLTFEIPSSTGFSLPFTAAVIDGTADVRQHALDTTEIEVFVYDPQKHVVNKRKVTTAGIQDNSFLVISGLSAGDRVASAGVSFLTDGQPVKLLED
jgi:multidrug efflux pump subunit AcrA (membrane-fusion protein)